MTSSSSLCVPWSFFTNCKTLLTERSWPVMRGFTHFHKLLARFYVVVPDSVTIGLKGVLFYGFLVVHRHVRCLSYWLSLSSDPPSLSGVVLLLISVYRSVSITNYLSINTFVSFLLFPSIFVTFRLSPSLVWKFFEFLSYQSEHFSFPWSDLVDWSSQNCFQLPGFHRSLLFCSVDCYPALFPVSPEVYYSSSWHQANLWRLWLRLLNPIKLDCWSLQWYSVSFSFLLCILPKVAGRLWFLVKLKNSHAITVYPKIGELWNFSVYCGLNKQKRTSKLETRLAQLCDLIWVRVKCSCTKLQITKSQYFMKPFPILFSCSVGRWWWNKLYTQRHNLKIMSKPGRNGVVEM